MSLHHKRSEVELPNLHNRCKRSELELRGPKSGLNFSTLQDLVRGGSAHMLLRALSDGDDEIGRRARPRSFSGVRGAEPPRKTQRDEPYEYLEQGGQLGGSTTPSLM
eukprot:14761490-Alexandrium_andersonii.AAC.1